MYFIIHWNILQRDFKNLSFSISKGPLKQKLMSKKYHVEGRSWHFPLSRTNIGQRTSALRVTLTHVRCNDFYFIFYFFEKQMQCTLDFRVFCSFIFPWFFLFFLQLNPFIENSKLRIHKNLILPHKDRPSRGRRRPGPHGPKEKKFNMFICLFNS